MLVQRDKDMLKFIETNGGLTIWQASMIFYKDSKFKHDLARKRLKYLYEAGLLKHYTNRATEERVYYIDKKISSHDVYLLNFHALMLSSSCPILEFKKEKHFMNGKVRSDLFYVYEYAARRRLMVVECDLTHSTDMAKYENLFESNEVQQVYGGFPFIVLITEDKVKYEGDLPFTTLDFKLTGFNERVLAR